MYYKPSQSKVHNQISLYYIELRWNLSQLTRTLTNVFVIDERYSSQFRFHEGHVITF